ncbi:hypothetical protein [Azospirillum sp. SYSU D00513]|uniref:hypothetical protein n=1 Tax=Azospirillum sp. SYSU D00513 TaxID=2812561 RepID=UPI001A978E3F|nr:hypothetical protein [Azospirillum sp. SYSU D00513]
MFIVTEEEAATIRQAYERGGEWVAVAELRRLFPGLKDNAEAVRWVRTIAAWHALPPGPLQRKGTSGRDALSQ